MNQTESQYMYQQLGISEEVWRYGQKTEESLKERFRDFDETAEYNQLKVIRAHILKSFEPFGINEFCHR